MKFDQKGRWRKWHACALSAAGIALVVVTFAAGMLDANSSALAQTAGGRSTARRNAARETSGNANVGQRQEEGGRGRQTRAQEGNFDRQLDADIDADTDEDTNEIAASAASAAPPDPQESERAIAETARLPARTVRFENKADAPVAITSASMKSVPGELMRRIYHDANYPGETYSSLPVVTLVNNSNERITNLYLRFSVNGREGGVILGRAAVIEPQNAYAFKTAFNELNAMLPVAPEEITVTLDAVEFEDGRRWGKPRPPHPPLPPSPPPPLPPAPPPSNEQSGSLRLLHKVEPVYPVEARRRNIEGDVTVEFTVNTNGEVVDKRILKGDEVLHGAALDALRQFRFAAPSEATQRKVTFSFHQYESTATAHTNQ